MKKIRLDQFTEYRFCSNLQAGSKPGTAAFVVTQANGDNGYDNHLWLLEDGQVRQLTSFNESNFIWEDEETLLFASLRDPKDKEALAAGEERTVFIVRAELCDRVFRTSRVLGDFKKLSH